MTDALLTDLDESQREAVAAVSGPVCVVAGAGTGKTRVITRRIAYGVATGAFRPDRTMALTFTAKAAGEMRGRLRALGVEAVTARTFHAAALAQLNHFWPRVASSRAPALVPSKLRTLAQAATDRGIAVDTATLREVMAGIEWRKVSMLSIAEFTAARPGGAGALDADAVSALHAGYEEVKDARHQIDFEDVLLTCAGMLETEPKVAQQVRDQYRHFTVDEFQDVSALQDRLLRLWLGDRDELCVVGDPNQAIYGFAGADPRYLLDFPERFPRVTVVRLERNHRSAPPVLRLANRIIRGQRGALRLRGDGKDGPDPDLTRYDTDRAEAEGVAAAVTRRLAAGARPDGIAVLYRTTAQSAELAGAFARAGIPVTVLGDRRFFDIPEVRQAIMALRAASVAPIEGGLIDAVRDVLRALGHTDEPPPTGGALREAWEARAALLALARDQPAGSTLRGFTDGLQARARDQHEPALATVTLATMHAAKGLEWDHVHIVGMSEGLMPISYARSGAEVDEERRLAYVAVTRARRTLSLSWSAQRGQRSRFLPGSDIRTPDAAVAPPRREGAPRRAP